MNSFDFTPLEPAQAISLNVAEFDMLQPPAKRNRGLHVKIKVHQASGLSSHLYGNRASKFMIQEGDWDTFIVTRRTANKLLTEHSSDFVQLVKE